MSLPLFPQEFSKSLIRLQSKSGGLVLVSPYGAHVMSWVPSDGVERLYLSPRSSFVTGLAIRGGVPLIFPQFGLRGNLPRHGFARTYWWNVVTVEKDTAVFRFTDNGLTQGIWPFHFEAEYSVHVDDSQLVMELTVKNTGTVSFHFTSALHTYLAVQSVETASLTGLQGISYEDNANNGARECDLLTNLVFDGEIDRLYLEAPDVLALSASAHSLQILKKGFSDVVVWNPGQVKCASVNDFEADSYKKFVCIEAASAGVPVLLESGLGWHGTQILQI